ncbi:bifunctional GTP1-OBG domain superfamily/GTP-binding protein Obg-CgtA/GTP binding domain/OBG-type guanine nucleotide-binding (G) domain/P-loop containing nucleoside triphosphate hydrolase/GTP1-OBG domain/Small GTP-binding protein domain/OBG-type GTPase [Babesia duncani]|uniref:Uncharacterized protein n=1 Tax=Babesia duncani TaxID=323732 RepID=A0AAD9UNA9_9APIC|nr:bifunctional GTP1-OBG domain superfamily/GTP-binding protein Obg-CgtA/GTP binding domain/OBG-type guanine nucleotide-binding (G) domain/P-loop containing nucleoside triphosphate hydrolase/GTP1-OBG domain/Small GTP-binding protein domain/OBG-type GTPase [Babesia duncani]
MNGALSIIKQEVIRNKNVISKSIVDIRRIRCIGGRGGDGCVAFSKHSSHRMSGPGLPFGGAGGRGGSVFVAPTQNVNKRIDLGGIPGTVIAGNGASGMGIRSAGAAGEDVTIELPLGTLVHKFHPQGDLNNWRNHCKNWDRELIADFDSSNCERLILAAGGCGGRGNNMKNPYHAEYGKDPEDNFYEIELKSIADVGLLGLPNVGKSSLLTTMTRASTKIGSYPFTTLSPVLGHIKYTDGITISVADLPGVIDCKLTQEFLRHVERTKALCYVLDACNPQFTLEENFTILKSQVNEYGGALPTKPFLVVISKMDITSDKAASCTDEFYRQLKREYDNCLIIPTSAKLGLGIASRF